MASVNVPPTTHRNSVVSLVSSSTTPSGMAQSVGSSSRRIVVGHHSNHHQQIIETKLLDDEGISVLPSSSGNSKDEEEEDILSESSDDIENIARQTLERIHETPPKTFESPARKSKHSSSDASTYVPESVSKNEKHDSKLSFENKKHKGNGDLDVEAAAGGAQTSIAAPKIKKLKKQRSHKIAILNEDEEGDRDDDEANIQNEFGICGWILTILSYILIVLTLPISMCMVIKVVQEYERAVIFRLGRLLPGGAKGPGIFLIIPCIDTYRKVDLRVLSFEVPPQEILSKDSVTVAVDAVVYFRISNATISVTNVEDSSRSTKLLAQTTLRNILGTKTLAEMLSDREAISLQMQSTLDEATEPWGVKVERVEVKDVRLPVQLQRAMAAEAEATREARAKVIVAEGEQKASRALKEAAEVIAESPSALQLRYLQTLNSISAEKNSTIIFPFPIDLLSSFLHRPTPKIVEPPQLQKKIRSCCLYKYPDWIQQNMAPGSRTTTATDHNHGHQCHHSHSHQHPPPGSSPPTATTQEIYRQNSGLRDASSSSVPGGSSQHPSTSSQYLDGTFNTGNNVISSNGGDPRSNIYASSLSSSSRNNRFNNISSSLPPPSSSAAASASISSMPFGRQSSSSSLLKQALANRITPTMLSSNAAATTTQPQTFQKPMSQHSQPQNGSGGGGFETTMPLPSTSSSSNNISNISKRDSFKDRRESDGSEMSKSILTNPAWYRDHEGKTGFKPAGINNKNVKESAEIKELNKNPKSMSPKIPTDISNYQNIPPPPPKSPKHGSSQNSTTTKSKPTSTLFCLSSNTNSMTTSEYENLLEATLGLQDTPKPTKKAVASPDANPSNSSGRQIKKSPSSDDSDVTLIEEKPASTNQKRIAISTTPNSPEKIPNQDFGSKPNTSSKREDMVILDARGHARRQFSPETKIPEPKLNKLENRGSPPKTKKHQQQSFNENSPKRNNGDSDYRLRRDSSQSDVSKFSHKSVTFNDKVQINEIERSDSRSRSQSSIVDDTTSSSSEEDERNNDGSFVDLDEHLQPLRKSGFRSSGSRETRENQNLNNRYIQEIVADESQNTKMDSQIYLTVTHMNHSGGSDVPEVSPTPLSQSWSSNEASSIEATPNPNLKRSPIPKSQQTPEFQPLPLPEKQFPSLRKTPTQNSNESYELQATFPKPEGMSDEEWKNMIQSIYVTETSNSGDPRNLGRDIRENATENDSIHSFYLEDIYGPDIYQQIHNEFPENTYNLIGENETENDSGSGTPPAATNSNTIIPNEFERRKNLDDWERLLVGSLTRLHAEDSDTGSVGNETSQPGIIRSASGYLDDLRQIIPINQYYPPLNVETNNKGYDASAEISPTDSKTTTRNAKNRIISSPPNSSKSTNNRRQENFQQQQFSQRQQFEAVPTPTASHLKRPETFQSEFAKAENLRKSYDSQETTRVDSLIGEEDSGNLDQMYSTPKRNHQRDERNVRSLSPKNNYQALSSKSGYQVSPISPIKSSQLSPPLQQQNRNSKIPVTSSPIKNKNKNFAMSEISQSLPNKTSMSLSPKGNLSPKSPHSPRTTSPPIIQQSYYDNVSPSNVIVTNVSVNLQPQFQQPESRNSRKSVGIVKTRVVASTIPSPQNLRHPSPSAPPASQFSTLETVFPNSGNSKNKNNKEKQFQTKFVKAYAKNYPPRKAPIVLADSEVEEMAPKDPKPSSSLVVAAAAAANERKHSFESILSTDSRESVVSATSFRAENKVRRYFNY